jgi:hypothetical protein
MAASSLQVFISHVDEDQTIALAIKTYLEQMFLESTVFVSGRDLTGGAVWFEELRRQLEEATAIIALISQYSKDSRWVYFESGAGFTRARTIPLAVGDITVDNLGAPMKILQARNLDAAGLKSLTNDLARMAGMRQPSRYPGLDEAIQTIDSFLKVRQAAVVTVLNKPSLKLTTEKAREDQHIRNRLNAIQAKACQLTIRSIHSRRAPFDIPSDEAMQVMELHELYELAKAIGVSIPFFSINMMRIYTVPPADMPEWKRINAMKQLEEIEKEWAEFETTLESKKS